MDYRRSYQPGGTFFFTVVTYRRLPHFRDHRAYRLLKTVIRNVNASYPFRVDAGVVLHDHLHMIWTLPAGDADYSSRWSRIKSGFTRKWLATNGYEGELSESKRREGRRGVWQPKFIEHTIRDESDFARHVEYIHYNPVKHGYVKCPKDWPWSSFHRYVKRGIYPLNWCSGGSYTQNIDYEGLE